MERRGYSVTEVMNAWGCSRETVKKLIRNGELTAFRVGVGRSSAWRITAASLDQWEATHRNRCFTDSTGEQTA